MASYDSDDDYTGFRRFLNPRDPKIRMALIAVLGIGTVALLWWPVSYFMGRGGEVGISGDLNVVCMKCNAESVTTRADLRKKVDKNRPARPVFADCSECSAPDSCVVMTKCPKCGKYFLSERDKAVYQAAQKGEGIDKTAHPSVCTHCKTDTDKYYHEPHDDK